jgi:hypothetical protein
MAMTFYFSLLQCNENRRSRHYVPGQIFRSHSVRLLGEWYSGEVDTIYGPAPVIGYKEWATDQDHFEGILDYRPRDVDIFEERAEVMRRNCNL